MALRVIIQAFRIGITTSQINIPGYYIKYTSPANRDNLDKPTANTSPSQLINIRINKFTFYGHEGKNNNLFVI